MLSEDGPVLGDEERRALPLWTLREAGRRHAPTRAAPLASGANSSPKPIGALFSSTARGLKSAENPSSAS